MRIALFLLLFSLSASAQDFQLRKVTGEAGRLSVHDQLLIFDGVSGPGASEVFLLDLETGERVCLTKRMRFGRPTGTRYVGQPAWHPDGEHILLQVESMSSLRNPLFNHPAWGFDSELWLITKDGTRAEKIYSSPKRGAALHPHFNKTGELIVFAERHPTGQKLKSRPMRQRSYAGESQWNGWSLHTAKVDLKRAGVEVLSEHRSLQPNGVGFYQSSGFDAKGNLLYDHTPGGRPYVAANYSCRFDGSSPQVLNDSPKHWDEHGLVSPHGLSFMSSRDDSDWSPRVGARKLRTELYLKTKGGSPVRLTRFNEGKYRSIISDMEWSQDGSKLYFLRTVPRPRGRTQLEIWVALF